MYTYTYICIQGFIKAILMSVIRHKKLNVAIEFETQSSYIYNIAIKIKKYLHVLYMQLFDYLRIHNIK